MIGTCESLPATEGLDQTPNRSEAPRLLLLVLACYSTPGWPHSWSWVLGLGSWVLLLHSLRRPGIDLCPWNPFEQPTRYEGGSEIMNQHDRLFLPFSGC